MKKEKAIYLVAGEPSGDFIGSEVISELLKLYPNMSIHGVGGHFMEKFSFKSLFPMNELSIMGIIPVLLKIVPLYRRINQVVEDILFKTKFTNETNFTLASLLTMDQVIKSSL